mmetsp:Transcript_7290/g.21525  ORF Transcript_7290/g.21525 Transcript_7290/m.21525 type:complete len:308 (+) Transcript_7290:380-1303(+)
MHTGPRGLHGAAHPVGARGAHQDLRRHPRAVPRPAAALRVRGLPARGQLPVPRRLRGPRQAVARDDLPAARVQDQVPGELLHPAGQPRVRVHQPHLRLLRRVQAAVQHQDVEDLHGLLQLPARGGHRRREDLLLPRRPLAGAAAAGPDQEDHPAHGRAGHGPALRPALVRPRQGHGRLGRERPRRVVHVRRGHRGPVPAQDGPGPGVPRAPGGGGRLRVLRAPAARDHLLGAQLLRRVRQRGGHDGRRRDADVLVPDPQAGREGQAPGDRGRGAAAGDAPGEEALRGIHFAAMTRLDAAGHPARLYI